MLRRHEVEVRLIQDNEEPRTDTAARSKQNYDGSEVFQHVAHQVCRPKECEQHYSDEDSQRSAPVRRRLSFPTADTYGRECRLPRRHVPSPTSGGRYHSGLTATAVDDRGGRHQFQLG